MDFRQLEYFKAVVEAGSVSRAAKNLEMTQPPVSLAVAKLERELGVQLLERTPHGVSPTSAGLYLLSNGGRLLADRDRVTNTLSQMGDGVVGDLRVGVEPMVINEIVADVLAEFVEAAPGVRVSLIDVAPNLILEGLRRAELDLGFVPFRPEQFANFVAEICEWETVVEIDLKLAVPWDRADERHPAGRGWGRWILPHPIPAFTGMPNLVRTELADDDSFEVLDVSTPQTAVPFVAAGLGVSPVTRRIAENYDGVVMQEAPAWMLPMQATILWRRGVEMTPVMQRWLSVTREVAARRVALPS